jgi:exosome complex RNA-binding protein Csl4
LADLRDRIDAAERRQRRLRNTVAALGREVGVSLGCPCSRCDECYLLVADGRMYCPRCGHLESV